jgi:two-component system sensor histidine kinase/response regulator
MMDIAEVLKEEIQSGKPLPDDTVEMIDVLIRTGSNMKNIISGFLDQEVLRQGKEERDYQPLDINNIVQISVKSNKDYAGRKAIDLRQTLDMGLPTVAANEFRLLQIMENLIGNAMKYCPRGSVVDVITRREGNELIVEIKDNGPGLREDDFPKLFIKHATLSNQPTGNETSTGVGLALCKQLIKLDNGDIGARNNPDAGVTFWISLPIS